MKKIILAVSLLFLTGCNYDLIDFKYTYDTAMIKLQDGQVITVEVKSWRDYEGDQIQIQAKNGTLYFVHANNCTLIKKAGKS